MNHTHESRGDVVTRDEIVVIGIAARTSNRAEMAGAGALPALRERFWVDGVAASIPNRTNARQTVAVYCDYEGDETGAYTLIVGYEVSEATAVPYGMVSRRVPAARYRAVSTERGRLPDVAGAAWRRIWNDTALEARRAFVADIEVYGEDAVDPENARFDILIGLK
ncbi:MAG: GyrI-like domain-containing protein [Spirochaetales bacterium]|nr:GyrI-like domain-containing protein [Spirochaetales bacterium]